MLFQVPETEFGNKWNNLRSADLACDEGFFSHELALKGCKEVIGIDARGDHIERANLTRKIFAYDNLNFYVGDLQKVDADKWGNFDVTLLFGILYHLGISS